MALVESEQVEHLVAPREDDDRGIGKADLEVGVGVDHLRGDRYVGGLERLEAVGAAAHLSEKRKLGLGPDPGREEVVELGEDKRGEQQWSPRFSQGGGCPAMIAPGRPVVAQSKRSCGAS